MKTYIHLFTFLLITIIPFCGQSQYPNTRKEGVDTLATINSFYEIGDFYCMDYSGDYSEILDWLDDQLSKKTLEQFDPFECSLFSANGDAGNQLLGRNFDNSDNDVLLTRYSPPDANASMAFTRMTDLGFAVGTNYDLLTFNQKLPLLFAAYFVPDGINEQGLSAGLASVDPVTYTVDPTKDTIFITRLIREILDHANTVDEALEIANSYNVFDNNVHTISHHLLVGTPTGESIVLE
ncbi:MAG: linear amide C-N hydrolase, partial [Bacteroidetes bacterium]|nr:linear amide C-N hydrolase [Bacteroidota bacterium]